MKKLLFFSSFYLLFVLTSCYQNSEVDLTTNEQYVTFDLYTEGVEQSSLTRAISEPGNLLIIDKFGEEITTDIKTSLGSIALPLDYGTHEIYFVAATKIWDSYNTTDLTVSWPNTHDGLSYVWAYHLTLEVDQHTTVEEITLPLVIANVQVQTLDKIPADISQISFEGPDMCKGLDLKTMSGFKIESGINYSLNISSSIGNNLTLNLFTFVPTTSNVGDIVVSATDNNSNEIASKTLEGVPVRQGYISLYSGYYFTDGLGIQLSYSEDWTGTTKYEF